MIHLKIKLDNFLFNIIIFLILIKLTFSYLNIKYGWWQRQLVPNIISRNFLNLPPNFQQIVAFVLIPLMGIYIIKNQKYLKGLLITFCLTFILYFLNIITSYINNVPITDSLYYSLRACSPIYFFIVIMIHYKKYNFDLKPTILFFIKYLLFLAVLGLIFLDPGYNRKQLLLPVYFSGIHSHNYVLVVIFMMISYFLFNNEKIKLLYLFLLSSFIFLILGYDIRTPLLLYFIYICYLLYKSSNVFKLLILQILVFVPFIIGILFVYLKNFDFTKFSSGRLVMYAEKIKMLKNYNFLEYLFGRGKGSDLIITSEWWYAKKGSHNDYLTFIVENGLPFLIIFLLLIFSLLFFRKKTKILSIVLIFGYLITSLISNGLALRPNASYLFFMFYAYVCITSYNRKYEK